MPYIQEGHRKRLMNLIDALPHEIRTPGELNFVLTMIVIDYCRMRLPSYSLYNEALGVFESAKQEFYRRAVVPYEDQKIIENGDVYAELINRS